MGYIDTTELGKTTMAVKSLAVILFSGLAAAEASYGYGVAIHPGYGTSYTNRSPQGLSYGGYGKRDAEPGYGYGGYGYGGYGAASVSVAQSDYGYGGPQSYSYGYNIGSGYGYGGYGY